MSRPLASTRWPAVRSAPTVALTALALSMTACGSLAPSATPQAPPLRADFRGTEAAPVASAGEASAWADFFTDARLARVVALALTGNRSLQASAAAVDRARALARISEADRVPDLDLSLSSTRQRQAGVLSRSTGLTVNLARWELDFFDRLGHLKEAALARYWAQAETQAAAQLSVVAETATAWMALGAERQRLRLAQDLAQSLQRSAALTEAQHRLGAASGLQRARAQAAYEAARGEAARSQAAVVQARLALELVVGQPLPEALWPTPPGPQGLTALPDLPAGLAAEVLGQRPDVRAAEQQLRAAAFDVGAARAARFPRISLTASYGRRAPDVDGLFEAGSGFWSLLPQLDLPLLDGGARVAQVQASEAARRQVLASYDAVVQAAFREVADALAVRDSLQERLQAGIAQVAAAHDALTRADRAYQLGGLGQLELLDAQRQLAVAQQSLVTLRQLEQTNRVTLLKALGGRWRAAPGAAEGPAARPGG